MNPLGHSPDTGLDPPALVVGGDDERGHLRLPSSHLGFRGQPSPDGFRVADSEVLLHFLSASNTNWYPNIVGQARAVRRATARTGARVTTLRARIGNASS